jgi:F-type H+-transporting ATPase subunit b
MTTRSRIHQVLAAGCVLWLLLSVPAIHGQTDRPSGTSASAPAAEGKDIGPGQQIARETREAAGEDDKDQFKKSAAVRFVAKFTGSLEAAYWVCVIFNFAVIAAVIIWFSRKSLPGLFRDRTASIRRAMEEARIASAEANERLSNIEKRLSRLNDEIAGMRAAAEKEAAAEEERIKDATAQEARKIAEAAGQEVAAAAKAARRELTAYAADLAVTLAKKQIHVDAATDQGLVRRFVEQLSNGNCGKGKP